MLTIWNQLSHSVFVFKKLLKMRMVKETHDIWSAQNKYKGKIRKYRNGTLKKKKDAATSRCYVWSKHLHSYVL